MLRQVAALLLLCRLPAAAADKFRLTLEPALDFHASIEDSDDLLFLRVAEDNGSTALCEDICSEFDPIDCSKVCGGNFPLDLGLYEGIEFSVEAPPGKEINITSNEDFRVRIEFQAKTSSNIGAFVDTNDLDTPVVQGSNVNSLLSTYNPSNSFVVVGKCPDGCSDFEIFTRLEFSLEEMTPFEGTISKLVWGISFDENTFPSQGESTYSYDTNGYTWIRTPFSDALIPAPTSTSSTSSAAPTSTTSGAAPATSTTSYTTTSAPLSTTADPSSDPHSATDPSSDARAHARVNMVSLLGGSALMASLLLLMA